ncbi:MAG: hypothetical protein JW874_07385 [Spirochaetales bacterium]|nr:hypothetical protein [Spirochaetales bacterium]
MKKILVLLTVFTLLVPTFVAAQDADNDDDKAKSVKTVNRIFGISIGFIGGYDLATEELVAGRDFMFSFTLVNTIEIGFRAISGLLSTGDVAMFDFGYYLVPRLCIDLMVGSDGANMAAMLDVSYALLRSKDEDIFRSSLKLQAGYIFETGNGIDSGVICAGLVGSIGY